MKIQLTTILALTLAAGGCTTTPLSPQEQAKKEQLHKFRMACIERVMPACATAGPYEIQRQCAEVKTFCAQQAGRAI